MNIKKVRGENRIHPIKMSADEIKICRKLHIKPETYIKELLIMTAKKRRWKWFFKQKGK